ncbi:F-box domain protein [Aspergillus homomorphus CBS 101889]|uniref:F-box domain-containing protein n=1 Tax=Aspergillus homomorphus (strain CBS 101889) TaxID=1450537 RepID=A0A395IFK6_ASPHC|nr:hypothetical protein BO97DRAFT_420347 [Aspergillus homomorphus CBS 101889]RAL16964.1 hypothetical protein BO97DRAFT_420347 [Aspergillus homomorphus CBS 101889]
MNPPPKAPKTNILTLPPELHLQITTHLPPPPDRSRAHLSQTNHYFRSLLPPPSHADLLAAELEPAAIAEDLYTCRYCVRLRGAARFADRMLRRGRGRFGAERERAKRFCLGCGVAPRQSVTCADGKGEGDEGSGRLGCTVGEARYGFGDLLSEYTWAQFISAYINKHDEAVQLVKLLGLLEYQQHLQNFHKKFVTQSGALFAELFTSSRLAIPEGWEHLIRDQFGPLFVAAMGAARRAKMQLVHPNFNFPVNEDWIGSGHDEL